jgi:hypothetical protein
MYFQKNISIALCILLLGLFPAFSLPTLQAIVLIMILGIAICFRQIDRAAFDQILIYRNFAFAQFALFFLLNALVFEVHEGSRDYYRAIALESWSVTILCLGVLALWLQLNNPSDVKQALIRWLPLSLTASFLVATAVYIWGNQGPRIVVFSSGALFPPLWFLVLTMCSFAWFSEMSRWHKIWRFALLFMAGVMVIYGSARLVMLAWVFSSAILAVWLSLESEATQRKRALFVTCFCLALAASGIIVVDFFAGGLLSTRMSLFGEVELTYDSISAQFPRLEIWSAALSVIADNPWLGIGKSNERFAIEQELGWDKWFRAHQTYLSYLIAGGVPALISGLILQSPVLAFLNSKNRSALFPAFLGLGVVVTMNCLTDSVFQSAVNVQGFMAATLVFLRASDSYRMPLSHPLK